MTRRWSCWLFCAASTLSTACAPEARRPTLTRSLFADIEYDEGPIDPDTKFFLVAGGDDVANFAAEIVEQRDLWRSAGVEEHEIACYYAQPSPDGWRQDLEQYQGLADALLPCHRATPGRVLGDLLTVAKRRPPWIYLYVTSHGVDSLLGMLTPPGPGRPHKLLGTLSPDEREWLDHAAIALEAGPDPRLGEIPRAVRLLRKGAPPHTILLTTPTLTDVLETFEPRTLKVVVLQACYSGGFVSDGNHSLANLDNAVVFTATAADRPSFGCGPGQATTYFGGAFNRSLARALEPGLEPPNIGWQAVFARADFAVEVMESVEDESPSQPSLTDTRPRFRARR